MKFVLTLAVPFLITSQSFAAADITAQNLVGKYRIDAKAFTKSARFRLNVINANEFEVQRIFDDHDGKICNGTFKIEKESHHWPLKDAIVFKGVGSCPDDRSKVADFKINFKDQSIRDIQQGASVQVTSSMAAGITVNAKMQRE